MQEKKVVFLEGQYFSNYKYYECINNGFYNLSKTTIKNKKRCLSLFRDEELFWDSMCQLKSDWQTSFLVNLSNRTINRQAWLGQATCCYLFGCGFNEVIKYWNFLNEEEKKTANNTAQKMINLFEKEEKENGKNTNRNGCFNRCERTIEMDF